MKSGIFVTGTDTEVGKTFVCAAIVRACKAEGLDVGYMKPVASGCELRDGQLTSEDVEAVMSAGDLTDPADMVCPVRYELPASPFQASLKEGERFTGNAVRHAFDHIQQHDYVVVEGIGGLSVPITRDVHVFDLASMLELPVIIVAANRLGVINHTLLTVEVARTHGLRVRGIVMNRVTPADDDVTVISNAQELSTLTGLPILAEIPYTAGGAPTDVIDIKSIFP
jgi:dethiobiotin synthetase